MTNFNQNDLVNQNTENTPVTLMAWAHRHPFMFYLLASSAISGAVATVRMVATLVSGGKIDFSGGYYKSKFFHEESVEKDSLDDGTES